MPNCLQLIRKSAPAAGPVAFTVIDEELCAHFGAEVHPKNWYLNWYDLLGFSLAIGKTFGELRDQFRAATYDMDNPYREFDKQLVKVIDYLDDNFKAEAWAEVGRRR